ncbi:MAG: cysteine hydrolase family protein [Pseudonocardiaceae bacterium]
MENAFGLSIPRTLGEACDPRRMALVVYDMQVGVVSQIRGAEEIVGKVTRVIDAARAGGFRIFYLRHMSVPKEIAGVAQLRTAMAWQRVDHVAQVTPVFRRDSPEFALVPELSPSSIEMIFDKISMSAFVGTPLDIVLRDCGVDTFAIVGVAMEVGIEPTVRHAADLGYLPVVVADACGAGNEAAAQRSLEGLAFAGDSLQTDVATICPALLAGRRHTVGQ